MTEQNARKRILDELLTYKESGDDKFAIEHVDRIIAIVREALLNKKLMDDSDKTEQRVSVRSLVEYGASRFVFRVSGEIGNVDEIVIRATNDEPMRLSEIFLVDPDMPPLKVGGSGHLVRVERRSE